jgi:uncharacterized membrane protein
LHARILLCRHREIDIFSGSENVIFYLCGQVTVQHCVSLVPMLVELGFLYILCKIIAVYAKMISITHKEVIMNRAELKKQAKQELRGNWGWATVLGLVMLLINGVLYGRDLKEYTVSLASGNLTTWSKSASSLASSGGKIALSFISGFFMLSLVITFLNLTRGRKFNLGKAIFAVFTDGRFIPELLNYLFNSIFTYLWTLLLVVPGIIKGYSYALTPYIVNDMVESGKEVKMTTGITESRHLMSGYKWQLFMLDLSFIGWYIVAFITLGIGLIWVVPYVQTTKANFYRQLAGDQFR